MPPSIWHTIFHRKQLTVKSSFDMYLSLLGNLSLRSIISNESSLQRIVAKSNAMKQEECS